MPQRVITGPIVDAGGGGLSGTVRITPIAPAGGESGFVVAPCVHDFAAGVLQAPVVAPGRYAIEVTSGDISFAFQAAISDASLADISLRELFDSRGDTSPAMPVLCDGDSLLRLKPGAGEEGALLEAAGDSLVWRRPPGGDLQAAVYDPSARSRDVFARGGHTGQQSMATIGGLDDALARTIPESHGHAASRLTAGQLAPARLGAGTANSSTFLRGDGTWSSIGGIEITEFYYQLAPGVNGQSSVIGQWVTLLYNGFGLNQIEATLAGDGTLTVPAGTYFVDVDAHAFACDQNQLRLYDVTADQVIRFGFGHLARNADSVVDPARLKATFTLDTTTELRVQHIAVQFQPGGYGSAVGNYWPSMGAEAAVEVYTTGFLIRKP